MRHVVCLMMLLALGFGLVGCGQGNDPGSAAQSPSMTPEEMTPEQLKAEQDLVK